MDSRIVREASWMVSIWFGDNGVYKPPERPFKFMSGNKTVQRVVRIMIFQTLVMTVAICRHHGVNKTVMGENEIQEQNGEKKSCCTLGLADFRDLLY